MTNDEFRRALETLWPGHGGQTRAAEAFNVSIRTIRGYLADPGRNSSRPVPEWLESEIRDLLAQFPNGVRAADPAKTLAVLDAHLQRDGLSPRVSAAMILAVAQARARRAGVTP